MSLMSRIGQAALVAATIITVSLATPASANNNAYAVICKSGQYDIDSRDETQLKAAFGTSYCTLRRFNYRSDAENFSRSNNMQPGKKCSCR